MGISQSIFNAAIGHTKKVKHGKDAVYVAAAHVPLNDKEFGSNRQKAINGLENGNAELFFNAFLHLYYDYRDKNSEDHHFTHSTAPRELKTKKREHSVLTKAGGHFIASHLVKAYAWFMDGVIPMPQLVPLLSARRRLGFATLINEAPGIGPAFTFCLGLAFYSFILWLVDAPDFIWESVLTRLLLSSVVGEIPMVGGFLEGYLAPNMHAAHVIEVFLETGKLFAVNTEDRGAYMIQGNSALGEILGLGSGKTLIYPESLHSQFVAPHR